jgi:hypothetical protein
MGDASGRATTRAYPPHPLPARPYYRTIPVAPCIVGAGVERRWVGALVAARPVSILHPPPYLNGIALHPLSQRGGVVMHLRSVFAMTTGVIIMCIVSIILDILGIILLLMQTFDKI